MVKGADHVLGRRRIIILVYSCLLSLILQLGASGCSHSQCNNVPHRPPEKELQKNIKETSESAGTTATTATDFVEVYKDSGQKQCKPNSGISIEKARAKLTKAKIIVLESRTQSDGKMRIQVCGAPDGQIHVFTIEKKYLKKAEKLGYLVLKK